MLGVLVTGFTAVCTVEILGQVWFQEVKSTKLDCRSGLLGLVQAVDRARTAVGKAPVSGGPSAALAVFRSSLEPEWSDREAVALVCQQNPTTSKALKQIEQLRYAEEHAVRYEAHNLSRQRRLVQDLLEELGLSRTPKTPPNTAQK